MCFWRGPAVRSAQQEEEGNCPAQTFWGTHRAPCALLAWLGVCSLGTAGSCAARFCCVIAWFCSSPTLCLKFCLKSPLNASIAFTALILIVRCIPLSSVYVVFSSWNATRTDSAAHFYNITIFLPPCFNPINLTASPYCSYKTSLSHLLELALLDLTALFEWPSLLLSQKAREKQQFVFTCLLLTFPSVQSDGFSRTATYISLLSLSNFNFSWCWID